MPETIPHQTNPAPAVGHGVSAALTGAWELTRALSPRESVRLAERLSDGEVIN
ncbi:MAG: hypothetical protein JWR01_222, partial [Subtercola sp.]|nr:hypothetical protein [Subtercola sp.]